MDSAETFRENGVAVSKKWHVLYTKPRFEKKVADGLVREGITSYCPVIRTLRQWSDRKKYVTVPMFPSYVFVHVSESERPKALQHAGVLHYVFWLGKPAVLREQELQAIRDIGTLGRDIVVGQNDLAVGDYVKIDEGIFKGLTGMVNHLDRHKLTLYISQLDMKVSFILSKT